MSPTRFAGVVSAINTSIYSRYNPKAAMQIFPDRDPTPGRGTVVRTRACGGTTTQTPAHRVCRVGRRVRQI